MMVPKVLAVLFFLAREIPAHNAEAPAPWMNTADPPQVRAHKLVSAMNFSEKTALFHGSCGGYTGNVCGNSRLGIPPLRMNDGPQGFRGAPSSSTAFPAAITIAASWDRVLGQQWGAAMGDEFYVRPLSPLHMLPLT